MIRTPLIPVKNNTRTISKEIKGIPIVSRSIIPKPIKQVGNKEFLVSDQFGNFWCGYRNGELFWSDKILLARELVEEAHFNSLVRWEKGVRILKKEYL